MSNVRTLRRLYAFLGFAGNSHFAWFTLGVGGLVSGLLTGAAATILVLPWWSLAILGASILMLSMGAAALSLAAALDWRRSRPASPRHGLAAETKEPTELATVREELVHAKELTETQAIEIVRLQEELKRAGSHAVATLAVPSKWMPTAGDLSSWAMTADDFDEALRRATSRASEALYKDAEAEFQEMGLLPSLSLLFLAWSQTADKFVYVWVFERHETLSKVKRGGGPEWVWSEEANDHMAKYRHAEPPPWSADNDWGELIRQAWHRERPFEGKATFRAGEPTGADRPGYITFDREDDGSTIYMISGGRLTELKQ